MTRRALWPAGLLAWAAVAYVVRIATTPAADGCDDRAVVAAFAWGGVGAIALLGADVVRRRTRGTWILLVSAILLTLAAWGATRPSPDGDCDHLVGLFLTLWILLMYATLIGVPIGAVYVLWRLLVKLENQGEGTPRPRRWRVEVKGSSLVITRRKPPG